jgi:hypothetical protein
MSPHACRPHPRRIDDGFYGNVTTPDTRDVLARLDRIQQLTEQLAKVRDDAIEQLDVAARIQREIEAIKVSLKRSRDR